MMDFFMLVADESCEMRNREVSIGFVKVEVTGDLIFLIFKLKKIFITQWILLHL